MYAHLDDVARALTEGVRRTACGACRQPGITTRYRSAFSIVLSLATHESSGFATHRHQGSRSKAILVTSIGIDDGAYCKCSRRNIFACASTPSEEGISVHGCKKAAPPSVLSGKQLVRTARDPLIVALSIDQPHRDRWKCDVPFW
jgi:hypothetical protein